MKKRLIFASILLALTGTAVGTIGIVGNIKSSNYGLKAEIAECAYHHGYHYAAKAATIDEAGHKEFWTCCTCQHQYLERPAGDFVDQDDIYMTGGINEEHIAYIAPITRGGQNGDYWINDPFDDEFDEQPKSRIIVMAGQSNAAGVGHFEYLNQSLDASKVTEIKSGYDNVLISGFSHLYIDEPTPVSANETSSSVGITGTFGFEVGLADRLSKAFPDETTYILKYAYGATSLNFDWVSPSALSSIGLVIPSSTYTDNEAYGRGWLYSRMVTSLRSLINIINDTTNTIPVVEAFMWMQGESDAAFNETTDVYLDSFNLLVKDFKNTFKDNLSSKFAVYDAAIAPSGGWMNATQMNNIKRSRVDEQNIYIDTVSRLTTKYEPIGSQVDFAHYDAACNIDLGHMFADAYLAHTQNDYSQNTLEISAPASITLTRGQNYVMSAPTVLFNGVAVSAKLSYFAEQHSVNSNIISYFTVNGNTFTPTTAGNSHLRITAYYNNEVRTVEIPVTVN